MPFSQFIRRILMKAANSMLNERAAEVEHHDSHGHGGTLEEESVE